MAIDNKKIFQTKKPGGTSKAKKKLADVSKEDMIDAGFDSFGKQSLNKYLNMKNKLGRKPTKKDFGITTKSNTTKKFVKKTDSTPTIFKKKKDDPISKITVKSQATKEEIDARTKRKKPKFGDESLIKKNTDMSKTKVIDTKSNKKNLLERIRNKKSGGKIKYNKGGGDLFVSRAYGGKIGD